MRTIVFVALTVLIFGTSAVVCLRRAREFDHPRPASEEARWPPASGPVVWFGFWLSLIAMVVVSAILIAL